MKERLKKYGKVIRMGLMIIALSIIGMIEYIQLMQLFDLPQVMLVIPLIGALAMIFLGKWSFVVPGCTIFLSCIYQIMVGSSNALAELQTNARSIAIILIECLSVLMIFELLGMAGGALIRILVKKKKDVWLGVICCVAGVILTLGPYFVLFRNPLYPLLARNKLNSYAEEHFTDYPIAEKKVYYSMKVSDYQCRVIMSDGQVRVIYIESDGDVTQE